jgi:hypothetical protein
VLVHNGLRTRVHANPLFARQPSRARLSNDVRVSDVEQNEDVNGAGENGGVLTNLPRTRPQRASARRTAARNGASPNGARKPPAKATQPKRARSAAKPSAEQAAEPAVEHRVEPVVESAATARAKSSRGGARARKSTGGARAASGGKRRATSKRPRPATPVEEPAPRQGYECDGEAATGPIQPPGGVELVASAAEIVGELAKAGVSTGERLLKDVLSRLPL